MCHRSTEARVHPPRGAGAIYTRLSMDACMRIHIQVQVQVPEVMSLVCTLELCRHIYIYTYICIHIYIHIYRCRR